MSSLPRARFGDPLLVERRRRTREYFRTTVLRWWFTLLLAGCLVLGVATAWFVGAAAALVLVAWAGASAVSRATREWFPMLLGALHMEPDTPWVEQLSPLLRSGDEREVRWAATDGRRRLLQFRSTDVHRDSDGTTTRTHHDYTLVLFRDAFPVMRFLSAHEHRVRWARFLGDDLRGRTIGGVEEFQVESVALHERFELRASVADGERARQVFEPSFIVWFARQGLPFEYEGGDLVVIVDRTLEHVEEYKLLLSRAEQIHAALTRLTTPPPSLR